MIRQIFKLLIDAALFEVRHLGERLHQEPAEVPAAKPAPVPETPAVESWLTSGALHKQVLDGTTCPNCASMKGVGRYWCLACAPKQRGAA